MSDECAWLVQWLDADGYPKRPVLFRHRHDIDRYVPGGLDEALAAINKRGWTAIRSGSHIVVLKTDRIELLTDRLELHR